MEQTRRARSFPDFAEFVKDARSSAIKSRTKALAPPSLDYEIVTAVYSAETIYGREQAGRMVDDLYATQGYDESSIEFREPTLRDQELYAVDLTHRMLYRDGACTGYSYWASQGGTFTTSIRGLDFSYDNEQSAQHLTVLVHDVISRARDDDRDSIPYQSPVFSGQTQRFVVTEPVKAYVSVGTRTTHSGDRVYEEMPLQPSKELYFFGYVTLASFESDTVVREVRFDRPPDEIEAGILGPLPERVPFPANCVVEVPLTYEDSHRIQTKTTLMPQYALDTPRVIDPREHTPMAMPQRNRYKPESKEIPSKLLENKLEYPLSKDFSWKNEGRGGGRR